MGLNLARAALRSGAGGAACAGPAPRSRAHSGGRAGGPWSSN